MTQLENPSLATALYESRYRSDPTQINVKFITLMTHETGPSGEERVL